MRAQDIPPHLHARYGITPPSPWRWVAWGAAVVVIAPVLLYAASRYVASQSTTATLSRWSQATPTLVRAVLHIDASAETRWCTIEAQDFNHVDVGFALLPVRGAVTRIPFDLAVLTPPVAVDVRECGTDPYALQGAQFPPGALPPAQAAPALAPGVYTPDALGALH